MSDVLQKLSGRRAFLKQRIQKDQAELQEIDAAFARLDVLAKRSEEKSVSPTLPTLRFPAEFAEYALRTHGPRLRLREIIERMYETGWYGSGDYRKDYKNLHMSLTRTKDRFRHTGRLWELVKQDVQTAKSDNHASH